MRLSISVEDFCTTRLLSLICLLESFLTKQMKEMQHNNLFSFSRLFLFITVFSSCFSVFFCSLHLLRRRCKQSCGQPESLSAESWNVWQLLKDSVWFWPQLLCCCCCESPQSHRLTLWWSHSDWHADEEGSRLRCLRVVNDPFLQDYQVWLQQHSCLLSQTRTSWVLPCSGSDGAC